MAVFTGLGSATSPSITFSADTNTGVFSPGADTLALATGGVNRVHITSAGLVGIGTSTPLNFLNVVGTGTTAVDFTAIDAQASDNTSLLVHNNTNNNDAFSQLILRQRTSPQSDIRLTAWNGDNPFFTIAAQRRLSGQEFAKPLLTIGATSGRVGIGTTSPNSALEINAAAATSPFIAKINTSEAARIDSSGRLLVGTSSSVGTFSGIGANLQVSEGGGVAASLLRSTNDDAGANLVFRKTRDTAPAGVTVVQNNDILGRLGWMGTDGTNALEAARISAQVDGTPGANDMPGRLVFSTTADGASSPTERMRITEAGNTFVNYASSSAIEAEVFGVQGATTLMGRFTNNTNTSGYNGIRTSIGSNGNNTSTYHFSGNTSGVNNWFLYGNGTTSYSSDERLKKNIETTRDGYLEDIRQLRVVKYNWKNHNEATPKELGLIAQEVEQVFPGLVQDDLAPVSEDDPTIYKQLKGSVIPIILLKALQEAAEKIETLEARLTAAGIE